MLLVWYTWRRIQSHYLIIPLTHVNQGLSCVIDVIWIETYADVTLLIHIFNPQPIHVIHRTGYVQTKTIFRFAHNKDALKLILFYQLLAEEWLGYRTVFNNCCYWESIILTIKEKKLQDTNMCIEIYRYMYTLHAIYSDLYLYKELHIYLDCF